MQWREESPAILPPPRNERYYGFSKSVISGLVRKLDQCIFDYNKEVCDMIEVFKESGDEAMSTPLKVWKRIDTRADILAGHKWYEIDNVNTNPVQGHAPITASLRD